MKPEVNITSIDGQEQVSDSINSGGGVEERPHYDSLRRLTLQKYGLTPDDYLALWVAQNGRCAICRRPETAERQGTPKMLAVDHDAATGRIRGLLCFACNVALGLFSDNLASLRAAALYLDGRLSEIPEPVPTLQGRSDSVFEPVPFVILPVRGEVG